MNALRHSRGFSLVEMAVAILILGMLFTFSVPALQSMSATQRLHGATEGLAGNLRMVREKAIASGQSQTVHFTMNYPPGTTWDYHIHNGAAIPMGWDLPRGVSYQSVGINPTFSKNGRANFSGSVVLRNARGERDTVAVQVSGLVINQ